jgi:hypothetical protein
LKTTQHGDQKQHGEMSYGTQSTSKYIPDFFKTKKGNNIAVNKGFVTNIAEQIPV